MYHVYNKKLQRITGHSVMKAQLLTTTYLLIRNINKMSCWEIWHGDAWWHNSFQWSMVGVDCSRSGTKYVLLI